jgi:hypothetical protein
MKLMVSEAHSPGNLGMVLARVPKAYHVVGGIMVGSHERGRGCMMKQEAQVKLERGQ